MTDTVAEPNVQQPLPDNPASVLAACREEKQLSLEAVASSLKLSPRTLQLLESGDFDRLPGDTFTRGYIRSYARLLGLDANRLALDYDRLRGIESRERQVSGISKVTPANSSHTLFKLSTLAIMLAILLSLFFWWREHQPTSLSERSSYPQDTPLTDTRDIAVDSLDLPQPLQNGMTASEGADSPVAVAPDIEQAETSESADVTESGELTGSANAETAETADIVEPPATAELVVAGANNRLQLSFSADCWVQVSSLGGQVLHSELMRAGQTLDLQHDSGMALVLGAAEAVASARFNDEDIQLTRNGQASGVVRVRLGE
ncbi:helix-turn-helix domain-containing protein [Halopseudomonas salegens]|uniref:Cytoskeleton protein RodZ n=1 Tax=Halopseudomonas salegens TaxID=1434072 RepID=A0A1H2GVP1_9GAMM|nr:helix-turn-helix domain-containing protein [Halopseudomonas salegens]SDU23569.1 cytoskeleton protein RodZ [Halopseudomonas salegens]